jgi:DNA topoisomerase-2
LFAHFWPSLLRLPGFLQEFITPIVRVRSNAEQLLFFTTPEYEAWLAARDGSTKGWSVKYFKGLGTSTAIEAKDYFSDLPKHNLHFTYQGPLDDEALHLAFARAKADARKDWLAAYVPGTHLSHEPGVAISYSDFVDKELIIFSMADNVRSIPSLIDGLKPGQRKILFCAFKRNLRKEIKVAQLAGYVSEHSAYHHGEVSLCSTIVGMAQNFVGSGNNINLFLPNGQFGTRSQGGKDAASARYIFTELNPVTRVLFHLHDHALLTHLQDDGVSIEPAYYMPILPMVLVNGSSGIGTGWSSDVPSYCPRQIGSHLRTMLEMYNTVVAQLELGEEAVPDLYELEKAFLPQLEELHPHYKGFTGEIKQKGAGSYVIKGVIEKLPDGNSIHIKELPVQKWTTDYKVTLEAMLEAGEIKEFTEHHTDTRASFVVKLTDEQMAAYESNGMTLYKKFKLNASLTTSNMVLFDTNGKLKRYATANDILIEFFHVRMRYYIARKAMLLKKAKEDLRMLSDKARFVREVNNGTIIVKQGRTKVLDALVRGKYKAQPKKKGGSKAAKSKGEEEEEDADAADDENEEDGDVGGGDPRAGDYDYLLRMPIWSLTKERAEALEREAATLGQYVKDLTTSSPSQLWVADLDSFDASLDQQEQHEAAEAKAATARSIAKRLSQVKSEEARKKLRAQLKPIPRGERVEDHTDDFDPNAPVKVKKPRAKKGATVTLSAAATATEGEAAETETTTGEEGVESTKKPKKKKAAVTTTETSKPLKAPKKKRKASPPPSDDDDSERDSANEDDEDTPPPPRVRAVRAAAATKKKYVFEDEEQEEDEDEEGEEGGDDASSGEEEDGEAQSEAEVSDDDEPVAEVAPPKKRDSPAKRKKVEESEEEEENEEVAEDTPRPKKQQKVAPKSPPTSKKSPAKSPAKSPPAKKSPATKRSAPSPKASPRNKKRRTETPVSSENEAEEEAEEEEEEIEIGEISDEQETD